MPGGGGGGVPHNFTPTGDLDHILNDPNMS